MPNSVSVLEETRATVTLLVSFLDKQGQERCVVVTLQKGEYGATYAVACTGETL